LSLNLLLSQLPLLNQCQLPQLLPQLFHQNQLLRPFKCLRHLYQLLRQLLQPPQLHPHHPTQEVPVTSLLSSANLLTKTVLISQTFKVRVLADVFVKRTLLLPHLEVLPPVRNEHL
jgi:hypothetical protein